MVNLLLDLGASLDATDDDGQKPIHMAAQSNKPEAVRSLLEKKPNSVFLVTKVSSNCLYRNKVLIRWKNNISRFQSTLSMAMNCILEWRY